MQLAAHRPCSLFFPHLSRNRMRWQDGEWQDDEKAPGLPRPAPAPHPHTGPAPCPARASAARGRDGRRALLPYRSCPPAPIRTQALLPALPTPRPQEDEMADVRCFHTALVPLPPTSHRPCSLPCPRLGRKRMRWQTCVASTKTQPPCLWLPALSTPQPQHD